MKIWLHTLNTCSKTSKIYQTTGKTCYSRQQVWKWDGHTWYNLSRRPISANEVTMGFIIKSPWIWTRKNWIEETNKHFVVGTTANCVQETNRFGVGGEIISIILLLPTKENWYLKFFKQCVYNCYDLWINKEMLC